MKTEKGLALQDLLTGAYEYVETIEFKPQARIYLLDYLAIIEYVFSWGSFIDSSWQMSQASAVHWCEWEDPIDSIIGSFQECGGVVGQGFLNICWKVVSLDIILVIVTCEWYLWSIYLPLDGSEEWYYF